jgi:hypothetical protein
LSVAAAPPRTVQVARSQLLREYVSGGSLAAYGQMRRALPPYLDDVSRDFGLDVYEKMLVDAQVAACIAILKAAIIEEGVTLTPAIDDEADPDYEQARLIADEATAMLDDLETPLDDVLWDLLSAVALGNRVAEQVYEARPATTIDNRTMLQVRALKVKPVRSVAFVTDAYMNVLGLVGAKPGQAIPAVANLAPTEIIPREKFCVLTWRPKDGDPRGTSVLRPAYDPWWRKRQTIPEYLKYLAQFAGPSVWATPGERAEPTTDPNDPTVVQTPEEALLAALLDWRNGMATALPFGTQVNAIAVQGEGKAFLNAMAACNLEITKAILTQSLATEEGEHMARAAAQVHADVLDTLVRQGRRSVVRMLYRDVLRQWIRVNWGDAAITLTPIPSLGVTEQRDLPAMMGAISQLWNAGYLHPSQQAGIDDDLNLPPRDLTAAPVPADPQAGPPQPAPGQAAQDQAAAPANDAPPAKPAPSAPGRVPVRPHERNTPAKRQQEAA